MSSRSLVLGSGPGTVEVPIGVVTAAQFFRRSEDGSQFEGVSLDDLVALIVASPITYADVDANEYTWTDAANLGITIDDDDVDITIPDENDVVSWPVGVLRNVFKINAMNGQTVTLIAPDNIQINGAVAGTDSSLPGFSSPPGAGTISASARILRASATTYWVF